MFKKKNREEEDTLIRPFVPADKLPAVPHIPPDSSEIPARNAPLDDDVAVGDRPSITDVWQFNRSGAVIYPRRNQYWLWMIRPLLRPFDFSGRSPRSEYLLYFLLFITAAVIREKAFDLYADAATAPDAGRPIVLILMFPLMALSVRRMHDQGKSGWQPALGILSILGIYGIVVDLFSRGQEHPNRYGLAPYGGSDIDRADDWEV